MDEFIGLVADRVRARSHLDVSFVNPNYLMAARRDPHLLEVMNDFDVMLPDGWGIVWASHLLGAAVPERLANDDIEGPLFRLANEHQYRLFLFGSAPGVADSAARRLTSTFPGITIAGTQHGWLDVERGHPGWFDAGDSDRVIHAINASGADILIVGLPTPLQQLWVREHRRRLRVPVVITGGSYLDHVAERIGWYPRWVSAARLCWLYRLAQEPGRLWKRYTIELIGFATTVVRAAARRRILAQH
jgi:N-acetylglucosaminyldiphosphoundecaprenol N-acetyl-beta-D-mannosaminyltransferase